MRKVLSRHWLAMIAALNLAMIDAAEADIVSLGASRDNTLYEDPNGALSNGAGEGLFAGRTTGGLIRRGLMYFDIAGPGGVPAGATINSATLTLHVSMTSAGPTTISLHRVLQSWGEGASNAPGGEGSGTSAAPGDATWLHTFFNANTWIIPGGDFDAASSAAAMVDAVGFYSWSSSSLAADVQGFLHTPSGNFGWLLRGDESLLNTTKRFDSRENPTEAFRPVLTIDFTPVPGPGALAMLALAAAAGRRSRNRIQ